MSFCRRRLPWSILQLSHYRWNWITICSYICKASRHLIFAAHFLCCFILKLSVRFIRFISFLFFAHFIYFHYDFHALYLRICTFDACRSSSIEIEDISKLFSLLQHFSGFLDYKNFVAVAFTFQSIYVAAAMFSLFRYFADNLLSPPPLIATRGLMGWCWLRCFLSCRDYISVPRRYFELFKDMRYRARSPSSSVKPSIFISRCCRWRYSDVHLRLAAHVLSMPLLFDIVYCVHAFRRSFSRARFEIYFISRFSFWCYLMHWFQAVRLIALIMFLYHTNSRLQMPISFRKCYLPRRAKRHYSISHYMATLPKHYSRTDVSLSPPQLAQQVYMIHAR